MSTTKRPRTTSAKKKPAKAAVSKARAKVRAKAPPVVDDDDDDDDDDDVIAVPAPVPLKKVAAKRGSKKVVEPPPPPPPPRPIYTLEGPVPPEGAGLPEKVGALLGVAQQALGIKSFRPGQAEAFEHLLEGEDLLAVMPTGSGKSLLYQLTSLVVPGVTVVVSPLIALIKDQIDKMVAKGVTAVRIDSTLTVKQRREVDALIRSPGGKLLLTTPERMADPEFRTFLREAASGVGVSRFVVDEAHCVSQWGHDFRPAYLSLRKALEDVGRPPVLATTATAPPHVREDILFQLGIEKATIVTTTFDRPNLHYEVIVFGDEDEKMKTLVTLLKKLPRPGIVYCATVKKVEELYEALTRFGIPTARYHGRMNKNERTDSQVRFMESSDLIMVATNAFGLGVDKANIRNVLHYHVPGSLEAYAQEAGRGGRDGRAARCVLLFSPDDVAIQEYFLSGTYPTKRQVRQVYEALEAFTERSRSGGRMAEDSPPTVANLALSSSVGQQRTRTVLSLLKDEHFIVEQEGGLYYVADPPLEFELLMERAKQYEARRIADRQRLDSLLAYVKAPGCRSQVILDYLGEPAPPKCGRCDNCLRSRELALAASTEATRLGASLTRQLDDDTVELPKPRREIKARIVRIDQPQPELPAAAAAAAAPKPTVLRRSGAAAAAPPAPAPPPAPTVITRSKRAPEAPVTNGRSATAVLGPPGDAAEPIVKQAPKKPQDGDELEDEDDDELDDDELDDDEEGEDGELVDDDDDDDDLDDDDDIDDDDDDDLDDDEVIDKTAAELAEEGVEGSGEITVLARKRVPKVPKQRPERAEDTPSANAAEARRRRRRRRRKRRAMLPPKSAFTTPVLSSASSTAEQPRRQSGGGGPVIEYVRGPMRIAMAPVASANPNDAGVGRRSGGGRGGRPQRGGGGAGGRRWERDSGGSGERRNDGPRLARPPRPENQQVQPPLDPNAPKRRRRRRRRRAGNGMPMQPGMLPPPNGGPNGPDEAPVAFFAPSAGGAATGGQPGPVVLGLDGQPIRKRRRRRRRGRGGRQREWRGPGGEGGGAPPGDDGGGGGADASSSGGEGVE